MHDFTLQEKVILYIKSVTFKLWKTINRRYIPASTRVYAIPHIMHKRGLDIGECISINKNVFFHCRGGIHIDDGAVLSNGCKIFSTGLDTSCINLEERQHIDVPVLIGKNVWLCANVTICPGVEIEEGIVVAAGSVVTKCLTEKNSLYGGVPAKFIKKLTEDDCLDD